MHGSRRTRCRRGYGKQPVKKRHLLVHERLVASFGVQFLLGPMCESEWLINVDQGSRGTHQGPGLNVTEVGQGIVVVQYMAVIQS